MAHFLILLRVAELADAPDLGSGGASRGGSSPFTRTIRTKTIDLIDHRYNSFVA